MNKKTPQWLQQVQQFDSPPKTDGSVEVSTGDALRVIADKMVGGSHLRSDKRPTA